MGFEIDFLPDGDGERGGDAIAIRYGNFQGLRKEQVVIVVDGGAKDTGAKLVEHIKEYYGTDMIDLVISTHPDADHSSGLTVVLENMKVGRLWLHRPWEHAKDIKDSFKNGKITTASLKKNLIKAIENAYELEAIATKKGIPIFEPFSDCIIPSGQIMILSPSKEFYEELLPNFRETPEPKESMSLVKTFLTAVKEGINWVAENWGLETLTDPQENETSAENNSSVIWLLQVDGKKFLFTGDAGAEAMTSAISKAETAGVDLKTINFMQIPHHGSKHNIGPTILNYLIGPRLSEEKCLKTAFVSAPKQGDPKHPSRKVTNAFKRRGAKVFATQGSAKLHRSADAPERTWGDAVPLPFYNTVAE